MVTETKKIVLECMLSLDAKCAAELLPPFLAEWYVPLIIVLPLLVIVLRHMLNGLVSMGMPMPFVNERIKDFTQDKARVSHLDRDVINHLEDNRQQNLAIMAKADAGLQWLYGSPIFSLASYQRALLIAVAYPLLVLLLVWLVSGVGTLGGKVLPERAFLPRLGLVSAFAGVVLFLWFVVKYHAIWATKLIQQRGGYVSRHEWYVSQLERYVSQQDIDVKRQWVEGVILLIAFFVAAAFAGAVVGNFAVVFAFFVAFALAVSGTFAVSNTVSVAFSGTGAVAVAFAFALGLAGAFDLPSAFAVAVAVALIFGHIVLHLTMQEMEYSRMCWPVILALLLYVILLLMAVYFPPQGGQFSKLSISENSSVFVLIVFLTCLPIINAFSDWFSVSFTRWLFGKYTQNNTQTLPWWWIVADLIFTVILCLALYHSLIFLLFQMQAHGWAMVDAQQTVKLFNDQPLGGQSSWLTWLVITNFIPLGLHYLMIVWGIYRRRWGVPTLIAAYLNDLQAGKSLSPTDARTLAMFLTWDRWLKVTAMLLLIPSMYMLLQWLLHWSLRVWL